MRNGFLGHQSPVQGIVGQNQAVRRQQLLREDPLQVVDVAILVGVDKDQVEFSGQGLDAVGRGGGC